MLYWNSMVREQTVRKVASANSAQTEEFAVRLGTRLKGGEVIELAGDVGSGKTTFVRGLARGTGSIDQVSSPTFTVSQVYQGKNIRLYHFDFYRLDDVAMIQAALAETLEEDNAVVVLEWAEAVRGVLPPEHIRIEFKVTGEDSRSLEISIPQNIAYLDVEAAE